MKTKRTRETIDSFNREHYQNRQLAGKPLPFSKLYVSKSIPLKYLLAAAMGVFYAILSLFFIKNAGGYSFGLSSLLQGIAKLCSYFIYKNGVANASAIYSALFWGLIFVVNIPLFFFSWKKIGKRFTLLTLTFLVANTASGLLFDLIPGINNVYVFGNTVLTNVNNQAPWIDTFKAYNIQILPFGVPNSLVSTYPAANYIKPLVLIVTTIAYAFVAAFAFSILFIIGGSTAGTDFFSTYLSGRSKMNISTFFFCLNLLCVTLGATLGSFIPAALEMKEARSPEFFFSANYIATIISLAVFTVLYKKIYPTGLRCKVEVYSSKYKKIKDHLYAHHYVHGSNITEVTGGYSGKKNGKFSTLCTYTELPLLLQEINKIDKNSTIAILKVAGIDGPFSVKRPGASEWKK